MGKGLANNNRQLTWLEAYAFNLNIAFRVRIYPIHIQYIIQNKTLHRKNSVVFYFTYFFVYYNT